MRRQTMALLKRVEKQNGEKKNRIRRVLCVGLGLFGRPTHDHVSCNSLFIVVSATMRISRIRNTMKIFCLHSRMDCDAFSPLSWKFYVFICIECDWEREWRHQVPAKEPYGCSVRVEMRSDCEWTVRIMKNKRRQSKCRNHRTTNA